MTAFKNSWQGQPVTSSGGVSPLLHVVMTHEVVHCYQHVVWRQRGHGVEAIPPWIAEGTAIYLAADDTRIAEPSLAGVWTRGYFVPESALTNRSYDAFGYYALLAHEGRDLWSLMLPAWRAAAKASNRSDAFIGVLQGDEPDIRNNWAESYLRKTSWGDPWIAYGFGLPDSAQVYQHPAQAQPAPGWTGSLQEQVQHRPRRRLHRRRGRHGLDRTASRASTTMPATAPSPSRTSASARSDELHLPERDQARRPGHGPATRCGSRSWRPSTRPRAGRGTASSRQTLAELCGPACRRRRPRPRPRRRAKPANPCTSACAESNGDPHMYTVDQTSYDFQAAGEFTLLRSADSSIDIQARQEPDGSDGTVSLNDGHRGEGRKPSRRTST